MELLLDGSEEPQIIGINIMVGLYKKTPLPLLKPQRVLEEISYVHYIQPNAASRAAAKKLIKYKSPP